MSTNNFINVDQWRNLLFCLAVKTLMENKDGITLDIDKLQEYDIADNEVQAVVITDHEILLRIIE